MKTSCTRAFGASAITKVLGATALMVGLGLSQQALAVQASGAVSIVPSDNTLDVGQTFSAIVRVTNASSETGDEGSAPVPAELSGVTTVTLACTSSTCTTEIPDTLDFVPGTEGGCLARQTGVTCAAVGENGVTITIGSPITLPAGGAVDIAVIQLFAKNAIQSPISGQFFQRAATGDNDITAVSVANPGAPVTGGAQGSTSYLFPGKCDVRVDKQISCDGGATWQDPGLVNANEDGTNGCQGLTTDQIKVRYQVSNLGSLDASGCVLTESNAAFGDPADPGTIAGLSTSAFIPGVTNPLCSAASGNEPDTATVTCSLCNGATPPEAAELTASDLATFSCLTVDLLTDRAVSCENGTPAGFNDLTLVAANEDGTNGPTTVDGESCQWKYQAKNNGTAPLYDCVLTDLDSLVSPAPILVGNLAAGQLVANIPATNTVACGNALETAEAPSGGRVDLACCTKDVASIDACDEGNRVQVYDVSTVTCQTPGLDVAKDCTVNPDTNEASFTVTATNTGQVALENCVATDNLSPDGLCPNTANPIAQVLDPAAPFGLAAGANQVLTGGATLTSDACNNVSVECVIAGTGDPISGSASDECPYTPEEEGCLTRTPGFWATHPDVTDNYLEIGVCGTTISNVVAGNGNSAIEAMCSVGKDSKIQGPQLTQLIRQCTAARLNVAASLSLEGNCDSDYPGIDELIDGCCGSASVCTGDTVEGLSVNECIYRLDMFNNTEPDTLNFDYPIGRALPGACQDSKNNGVVVYPTP